jgi:hypothetical protein
MHPQNITDAWQKVLKIQVQKRLREIKNADDLRRVVLDIWTDLGLHYIQSLYDSISMMTLSLNMTQSCQIKQRYTFHLHPVFIE